jgi:hypothetical protein
MAIQLKLTAKSGTVKKLGASSVYRPMSPSAVWYDSLASSMSLNDTLSISGRDVIVWEGGDYIEIEFTADSSGSDGQGINVTSSEQDWSVVSLSGTVKRMSALDIKMSMKKTDIYSDAGAVTAAVSDELELMDSIVCNKSGVFTLKLQAKDQSIVGPLVLLNVVANASSEY